MKDFFNSLLGRKKVKKDITLSKECQLFMAINRKTGAALYAAKGTISDPAGWGKLEYHVKQRLTTLKKHFDFIPDELVMCWHFDNIDKTPVIDDKYQSFVDFLKDRKPDASVSLREFVYRRDNNLGNDEKISDDKFQSWCNIQDSLQQKNSFDKDIVKMADIMAAGTYNEDSKQLIAYFMDLYKDNDQLLPKFLEKIEALEDTKLRIAIFRDVEPLIENSHYYQLKGAADIKLLLGMPVEDMRPIHILSMELLCDNLECKTGRKLSLLSSQLGASDLKSLKKQLFAYHKKIGKLSVAEEAIQLECDFHMLQQEIKEFCEKRGCYSNEGNTRISPPVKKQNETVSGATEQPTSGTLANVKSPEYVNPSEASPGRGASFREQLNAKLKKPGKTETLTQSAGGNDKPDHTEESAVLDISKETAESLQRLSRGSLLRKEIDKFKTYPEITVAQLEWAFNQPYITTDLLISNGTMVGSVMATRFFENLSSRIGSYSGVDDIEFSPVEENVISAYATVLSNDIKVYSEQIANNTAGTEFQSEIQRMIISNKTVLQILNPLLEQLRGARENARLLHDLDQTHRWLGDLYSSGKSDTEKKDILEKLLSLLFLRHDNTKYITELIRDIRYYNGTGNPGFLYTRMASMVKLSEYGGNSIVFRSPELFDTITPGMVTWLDAVVAQIYSGVARFDLKVTAERNLSKVMGVISYFNESEKKVLPWITKDLAMREIDIELADEKVAIFDELAVYMADCYQGISQPETFNLKDKLEAAEKRIQIKRDEFEASFIKKKARKSPSEGIDGTQKDNLTETCGKATVDERANQQFSQIEGEIQVQNFSRIKPAEANDTGTSGEIKERDIPVIRTDMGDPEEGLISGFDSLDDLPVDLPSPEEAEIDDELLAKSIDLQAAEGMHEEAVNDETEQEGENDMPVGYLPVFYIPERDKKYPHPFAPDWTWLRSHLYAVMGDSRRKLMLLSQKDEEIECLRFVCMSESYLREYLHNYDTEITVLEKSYTNIRMFQVRAKSWEKSDNPFEQALFAHVRLVADILNEFKSKKEQNLLK